MRLPSTFAPFAGPWHLTATGGDVPHGFPREPVPAVVPGLVHTDLLRAGLIADPFDGDNEAAQQWIGSTQWRYSTTFDWADDGSTRHDLVALGLDTVATIELNGQLVARTENQHRSHRFDVRHLVREGANELTVTFAPPVTEAERRDAEHGAWPHVNHHPFNQLRKTASTFGWDWGIDVASSGIWQPIGIESWSGIRIASVRPLVGVDGTDGVATVHVEVERDAVSEHAPIHLEVRVGEARSAVTVAAGEVSASVAVRVADAKLWWPIGHGEQPLYDVTVAVTGMPAARWAGRIGFRTVEVDTAPDASGNRFVVRVNGEDVLIRGVNWIPDHAFVTELNRDRYVRRLADALEANVNLLRVWGGGFYESDDFYELADEAGLLVWQDFLFACAAYSEEEWLANEVEAEAREQIARLAQHPSLIIWNGNNENIWGYVEWGWREALGDRGWGDGYYRDLFPRLLAELDPTRAYSPASPYSFVDYAHPNDERNGTMHIWDVWNQRDYTAYRDYAPRFVSEFGFQGPPAWSTLTRVVHDEPLAPYGHEMLVHQKAESGNLKLELGMAPHLPAPRGIEEWHWATQLNQAHAIRFGVEHFRSLTPHNTGTILWQLNDDWPVVSWAAVDFDEHRKPLWHAMRDAYAPRLATIQPRDGGLALVLVNDSANAFAGTALLTRRSLAGAVLGVARVEVDVAARSVSTYALPSEVAAIGDAGDELVVADLDGFGRAVHDGADVIAQRLAPDAAEASAVRTEGGYRVSVRARSYLRDVFLAVDRLDPAARVDAGLVSLLAGEVAVFHVASEADLDPGLFTRWPVLASANALLR
ncbi:glycoside hydrolase family 2 protein [Humibacter ginsenosidimutans]|uniref:beta-mannosidase n=1 Tax=Humibacter ginsenosidimutans TaxID=2599293 RepID=A0A5B8M6H8_9MICO|nr:glycoside hydrolase family 2 protein [Humibacter ginsenosidimutans]QDZ15120.1 glycoside hydrolase family 2 protein [Humibacter ginsenosidimutans]